MGGINDICVLTFFSLCDQASRNFPLVQVTSALYSHKHDTHTHIYIYIFTQQITHI
jgi:hypothetical protein